MRIAFYAPLKPPDHDIPSGDRRMARLLIDALQRAGHEVALASRFRSYDGEGDTERQERLRRLGSWFASRYLNRCFSERPDLWFTYHLYHKAPDWLGPVVTRTLGIPYVVAEASIAPKQQGGPWAAGHDAVAHAVRAADRLICVNREDAACLRTLLSDTRRLVAIDPFLDAERGARARSSRVSLRAALAARLGIDPALPWISVVAMMRPGDKLASYRLLGEALGRILDRPWVLLVAGDGAAKAEVAAALDFKDRVYFLGMLETDAVDRLHAAADIGAWPAINEAYGMAVLEAQAAGLPLVVGDRAGVRQLIAPGKSGLAVPEGDVGLFAEGLASLLDSPHRRAEMADAAVQRVQHLHDLPSAVRRIGAVVDDAVAGRLQAAEP